MPRLRVQSFAVSLDGYGAGPNQDLEHPLGVNGPDLMEWFFATRVWRKMHGQPDGELGDGHRDQCADGRRGGADRSGHVCGDGRLRADRQCQLHNADRSPRRHLRHQPGNAAAGSLPFMNTVCRERSPVPHWRDAQAPRPDTAGNIRRPAGSRPLARAHSRPGGSGGRSAGELQVDEEANPFTAFTSQESPAHARDGRACACRGRWYQLATTVSAFSADRVIYG